MADDEYEGGPDQLAEKMAQLDEQLAEARAETLRAGLADYDLCLLYTSPSPRD